MSQNFRAYLHNNAESVMNFDFSRSQTMSNVLTRTHPLPACILIAGTNGKGSTTAFLSSILQAHGLRVGTFTSPHLVDVCERVQINGQAITDAAFQQTGALVLAAMQAQGLMLTYFEVLTFLAWMYFSAKQPDVCLFEIGLGGRLDTTNVIKRVGAIVSKIDLDHNKILGPTTFEIAQEKAAIFCPEIINISAKQDAQAEKGIHKVCDAQHILKESVNFSHSGDDQNFVFETTSFTLPACKLGLVGQHQSSNASLAVAMADRYFAQHQTKPLDPQKTAHALSQTKLRGRMETWQKNNRTVIIDIAHNPASIQALTEHLTKSAPAPSYHILFGCSADKDAPEMLQRLAPIATSIKLCKFDHPRSWQTYQQQELPLLNIKHFLHTLPAEDERPILCAGSIFFVGYMIPQLQKLGFYVMTDNEMAF